MTTILATYYAKIQDVPDSEYKVEILEDGPVKKVAVNGKVYDVDYNVGGDSIYSIIINHHSHGVQISPTSHSSYTIMNKGELYQIELKGELEKIHNARSGADAVGRQVVVVRTGCHEDGKRNSFGGRWGGERDFCGGEYESGAERTYHGG